MSLKHFAVAVQTALAAALLALVFHRFDWSALQVALVRIPFHFYLTSFLILVAGQALYVLKWRVVLGAMGCRERFRTLAELYLLGTFFNNFLPTMIGGDAVRIYYLGRQHGFALVATSVLVDRGLGFLSMAVWGTALVWWLDITTPAFMVARQVLTVLGAVLGVSMVAALIFRLAPVVVVLRGIPMMKKVAQGLELLRKRGRPIRRRPVALAAVMATSFLYFLPLAWAYQTYFRVAGGLHVPYAAIVLVLVAIAVLSNIPISLNGIGLREQLHYLLFGSLGVSKELAVGISLIVFSQFLVLSVLGGLVWLRQRDSAALADIAAAR